MNREIPGFYYDSVKRKYFRIEKSQTAPAQAEWSAQNVKRRAAAEQQAEDEKRRQARLRRRDASGVRRLRAESVPLMGGLLSREAGVFGGRGGAAPWSADEMVARSWVCRLAQKGEVRLWPGAGENRGTVSAMWVGGGGDGFEEDGLGVVCGVVDGFWASSSLIPRDEDDRINFQFAAERYPRLGFQPKLIRAIPRQKRVTAIKCHESSSRILLACEDHESGVGIWQVRARGEGAARSNLAQVLRGGSEELDTEFAFLGDGSAVAMHALQPAPSNSRLTCIAGTDRGIVQLQRDTLTMLTPPPQPGYRHHSFRKKKRPRTAPDPDLAPWQSDILSVDFLHQNSADLILAGTRSSRVCLLDLRVPPREWSVGSNTFRHHSSAAHVRSVGSTYHVLAAGPRDAMALYDIRFLRQRQQQQRQQQQERQQWDGRWNWKWNDNAALPLFTFPSYRNAAHIRTGLDVLTEPGYGGGGGGIVAAAHATDGAEDRGTVTLYSLQDGARIPAGEVDAIRAPGVVQSLMWQTLPGDRHPSLFVGEGPIVRKYSFWA
ncbi:hypothetical protein P885DRAFT_60609 [Corynascus similis CBS 632.67]